MSTYIPLGKAPLSPEERRDLLSERVEAEERLSLTVISNLKRRVVEFLIYNKGYKPEDIEVNKDFYIKLPEVSFILTVDIRIKLCERVFLIIKCASSPESWKRYSLALSRVIEDYLIPYAVVTDGETSSMIDTATGRIIAEGLESIPSKEEALNAIEQIIFYSYPSNKLDREKRILHAFI